MEIVVVDENWEDGIKLCRISSEQAYTSVDRW